VDSAVASGSAPTFSTSTATVSAGTTATYPVTLPSSASNVSVQCLNLPAGSSCSYSSSGAVSVVTGTSSPTGTYHVTVVFTETLPGSGAPAFILAPFLLLPLLRLRRKFAARGAWITSTFLVALSLAANLVSGCGGAGSSPVSSQPVASSHQVTVSGTVTLTIK